MDSVKAVVNLRNNFHEFTPVLFIFIVPFWVKCGKTDLHVILVVIVMFVKLGAGNAAVLCGRK